MANAITCSRILLGILLLIPPAYTPAFLVLYLLAGCTDLLDGPVARQTNTVSTLGAQLDTAADIVFFAAAVCRLAPAIPLPAPLIFWIAGIALVKLSVQLGSLIALHRLAAVHSALNRLAGVLLFLFPLSVPFAGSLVPALVVCSAASAAAACEAVTCIREIHAARGTGA